MENKGIVNGKILKTNTVDIRDSLNQYVYTTNLSKPKDIVNVAALNYVNNFNIIDGTALPTSQITTYDYFGTPSVTNTFNVFKQKNGRKLEFRNITSRKELLSDDSITASPRGVVVNLYNDDIQLYVDEIWLKYKVIDTIKNNLSLQLNNGNIELVVLNYFNTLPTIISSIDACELINGCSNSYGYDKGKDGLGSLD